MIENNYYTIKYTPFFNSELDEITKYIDCKLNNPNASKRLLQEIQKKIDNLKKMPKIYGMLLDKIKSNNKWYKIKVKNYLILYVIKGNFVIVFHIFYGKRNIQRLIDYYVDKTNFNY